MRNSIIFAATFALSALLPMQVAAGTGADDEFLGVWKNPKNSVHVRTYMCGKSMCGTVIWASSGQQEAAREAGTEKLIGKQLFSEFVRSGDQSWRGKVFVPKQGKTFPGTVKAVNARTMEVRGCALGGLICKSQIWTRLETGS